MAPASGPSGAGSGDPYAPPSPSFGSGQPPYPGGDSSAGYGAYGQPSAPGAPGAPGGPGTGGPDGPPPKKRRRGLVIGLIAAGVVLLLCCVAGAIIGVAALNNSADFESGKCVKREDGSGGDRAVPVSCSDADAYRILRKVENTTNTDDENACPDNTTFTFVNFDDKYVLCLREA